MTRSSLSDVPDQVVSFLYQLSDLISDQHLMWGVAGPGADVFSPFGFGTIPLDPDTDLRDWFLKGLKLPLTTSLKNKRLDLIDRQWAEGFPYELMATARWLVQRLPGSLNQETFAGTSDESPWFVEPRGAPVRLSNPMPMLYLEPERPLYISAITGGACSSQAVALKWIRWLCWTAARSTSDIDPTGVQVDIVFHVDGFLAQRHARMLTEGNRDPRSQRIVIQVPVKHQLDDTSAIALIRDSIRFAHDRLHDYQAREEASDGALSSARRALNALLHATRGADFRTLSDPKPHK
jgi:hypothetical protein